MLTWPAAPAPSLSSNYLVQSRLRHQQELPNGSEIQGSSWAPLFVWSSQDRQHGEARPGEQSPRKSLLPALGVTAGQKSTFFQEVPFTGSSAAEYHTIPHHTTPYRTIPHHTACSLSEAAEKDEGQVPPSPNPSVFTICNTHRDT